MAFQIIFDGQDNASIDIYNDVQIIVEGEPMKTMGSNIRPITEKGNATSIIVAGANNLVTVKDSVAKGSSARLESLAQEGDDKDGEN